MRDAADVRSALELIACGALSTCGEDSLHDASRGHRALGIDKGHNGARTVPPNQEDAMAKADIWPTIHAERRSLADDLDDVTDAQWAMPSLCEGWSVHDVLAHMTATAKLTPPQFFAKMIGSGFKFGKVQEAGIASERAGSPAETLGRFKAEVDSSKHPPGPPDTWLGETLVHSEDIRRPLGIAHEYPIDAAVQVADFYKGSNLLIGAKKRVTGLALRATDADWSHGDGPEVTGPIVSLVLAMTGRRAVLDDLAGDGVATLRGRI